MLSAYPEENDYLSAEEVAAMFAKQKANLESRFAAMAKLTQSPSIHAFFAHFGIRQDLRGYRFLVRALELNTQIAPDSVGQCTYASILKTLSLETGYETKRIDRNLTYLLEAATKDRRFSNFLKYVKSFDGETPASVTPAFFLNTLRFLLYKQILTGCFDSIFNQPLPILPTNRSHSRYSKRSLLFRQSVNYLSLDSTDRAHA